MAVGLQSFIIKLDGSDSTFAPGENVAGRVIVQLGRPKNVRGLKIRFKGSAKVEWSESTGTGKDNRTEWYTGNEHYFRIEIYLFGGANTGEHQIEAGQHVFPFNFALPHNIPSSFQHKYGSVQYTIKAILDRPWKFDHQTSISFDVEAPFDLTRIPATQVGISDEEVDTFCCFSCFNAGSMTVNISLPTSGFVIGEAIQARFAINNNSTSVDVTNIIMKLKQKIKFFATGSTKSDSNVIQRIDRRGPYNKIDDVVVKMTVPAVHASTFPYCGLIDIVYVLEIRVVVSTCHCDIERTYPIFIGTKPALAPQQNLQTIAGPTPNPVPYPAVQANEPSAPFLGAEGPTAMPLPEKTWNEKGGPTPYPPNPSYGFGANNQPYPPTMPGSSAGTFQYPPATNPSIGFVIPDQNNASSSSGISPPSYADVMATEK